MPSLPFYATGKILTGATVVATEVPISVWPAPGHVTDVGMDYDHDGEASITYEEEFRTANARIVTDDVSYHVVDVQVNRFFPHLALKLRSMREM